VRPARIAAGVLDPPATSTVQEQLGLLSSLIESSRLLKGKGDPDALQWTVVETILRAARADGCSLALEGETEERVVLRAGDRLDRRRVLRSRALESGMVGGDVYRGGTLRAFPSIPKDPPAHFPAYVGRAGFRSGVVLPVLGKSGIVGVMSIYFLEPGKPEGDAFEVLVLVNQVASVALENATLYQEVQRSYVSTIEALTTAIDAASPMTHGHSKRVTQFALILGESVGLSPEEQTTLRYGALLHDIGKLGVKPQILEKQGALSEEELGVMREHPVIGERIIAPVEFLQAARPIVRHHHERWDGKGYPDRMRGEEVPLAARIVSIADFYDAMISMRPYKRALRHEDVAREIARESGAAFDPDLSERFLDLTRAAR
jgi:hypothetical protein